MPLPEPKPAQVLRYAYLWADEHENGRDEGRKIRPVVVTIAVETSDGDLRVVVVPVTHALPKSPTDALEIPASIKRHLGLDDERSFVVLTELNFFNWPGPDLGPLKGQDAGTVLIGYLPSGFFRSLRDRLSENIREGRLRQVQRTE